MVMAYGGMFEALPLQKLLRMVRPGHRVLPNLKESSSIIKAYSSKTPCQDGFPNEEVIAFKAVQP